MRAEDQITELVQAATARGRSMEARVLVAKGLTNPEVAEEFYVSRKAVEYHLSNIYGKLGITSRRELRGLTF
jgi:DNA-binding NarL/FixJ family response regulator